MVSYVVIALAMLGGSLWMALAPQVPAFRSRRAALAWATWLATRGAYAALLTQAGVLRVSSWPAFLAIAGQGALPGSAAVAVPPVDAASGGAWLVALVLATDFAAWRALAAAEGGTSEAAWSWVASPLALWIGVVAGAPRVAAVALVAVAYLLQRRGRDAAGGLALGAAAAWGGPAALAAALALALAPGRRFVRAGAGAVAAVATFAALRAAGPAAWGWTWLPAAEAGGGAGLWRLVHAFAPFVPGPWAWLPCAALAAAGFVLLVPRGAGAPALAAWAFAAFAAFAPSFPVRWALPFAPLLAVWVADDPDRRGWWFIEALVLALTVVLEVLGFSRGSDLTWRLLAIAGAAGAACLALWPLGALLRRPGGIARA